MKLFTSTLLFFVFLALPVIGQVSEPSNTDKSAIIRSVKQWADSTFFKYDEPRFENFTAHYTDEYIIASLRTGSIEKSIKRLVNSKEKGTYTGTEEEYNATMKDLEQRKEASKIALLNFSPKVTHYSVVFWANIKLDSGIYNYVKHELQLNQQFEVIGSEITGNIGDNSKGTIIYK
jgi:hypothetical protein